MLRLGSSCPAELGFRQNQALAIFKWSSILFNRLSILVNRSRISFNNLPSSSDIGATGMGGLNGCGKGSTGGRIGSIGGLYAIRNPCNYYARERFVPILASYAVNTAPSCLTR